MTHLIDVADNIQDKLLKLNDWIEKEKLTEKYPEMKEFLEELDDDIDFFWGDVYDEVVLYKDTVRSLVEELEEVVESCDAWQKEGPDKWIKNSDEFIEALKNETQDWVKAIKVYFRNKAKEVSEYSKP